MSSDSNTLQGLLERRNIDMGQNLRHFRKIDFRICKQQTFKVGIFTAYFEFLFYEVDFHSLQPFTLNSPKIQSISNDDLKHSHQSHNPLTSNEITLPWFRHDHPVIGTIRTGYSGFDIVIE